MVTMFRVTASTLLMSAAGLCSAELPTIGNGRTIVRTAGQERGFTGFDVLAGRGSQPVPVAEIRWQSGARWFCRQCDSVEGALRFRAFATTGAPTPQFAPGSIVQVRLEADDPFPQVSFVLDVAAFAADAWRLAEVVVYRNLYPYTADPDPTDTLDPAFLLQAVNSHYWLGQVTWGEMERIPEMAIQLYLETGDPYLRYLVRGCLERFYIGTISPRGEYTENLDYAFAPEATYAFTVAVDANLPGAPIGPFDVMITSPRRSLHGATATVDGQPLAAGRVIIGRAGTDAMVRGLRPGDRVQIGAAEARPEPVPLRELCTRGAWQDLPDPAVRSVDLREHARAMIDDRWCGDWGGLVPGPGADVAETSTLARGAPSLPQEASGGRFCACTPGCRDGALTAVFGKS